VDPQQRLCLHMTQRSCDTALGVPYNLAGYAFLLHLFAHLSGIEPGIFGHTLIDAHVYTCKPDGSQAEFDHVPGLLAQLQREPRALPRLTISDSIRELSDINALLDKSTDEVMSHFVLDGYDPWPKIDFKVAV
jgi:thymidylate synthase